MSAIRTNQLNILAAKKFVADVESPQNSYYTFIALTYPEGLSSTWETTQIAPKDSFDDENIIWDSMIALKKIGIDDVNLVVNKNVWESGRIYDMYRHNVTRDNLSKPSNYTNLYYSNYYVVNQDYRVYICLNNGTNPEYPNGRPSLDEPLFTDLEPRSAGTSGDGYIWKYLYTIKPSQIIKFDSVNYIPVPKNWSTNVDVADVRNNATTSGQLKVVLIANRGSNVGPANRTYTNIPIKGDGSGAEVTIVVNSESKVESVTVTNGGSNYTYGTVDLSSYVAYETAPVFNVIIPPQGGHGYDIYRELGSTNVMIYSRIENDTENPDFITGNKFARVGIVQNPKEYDTDSNVTSDKLSSVGALILKGDQSNPNAYQNAVFNPNSVVTQTVGTGLTAAGRVVSYDSFTGVLKYSQDRSFVGFATDGTGFSPAQYGYQLQKFTSSPSGSGSLKINNGSIDLYIDSNFGTIVNPGVSTVINNRTYYLGQKFISGVSNPEVKKYSGNIIYVDNMESNLRTKNQKEDSKIILQF